LDLNSIFFKPKLIIFFRKDHDKPQVKSNSFDETDKRNTFFKKGRETKPSKSFSLITTWAFVRQSVELGMFQLLRKSFVGWK